MSLQQVIVDKRLLAPDALARARLVQAETGERLDSVLTRLGLVSEDALARAVAADADLPLADRDAYPERPLAMDAVSPRFLRDVKAAPLRVDGECLDVAFADPYPDYPARALAFATGLKIRRHVGRSGDIEAALDRLYGGSVGASAEDEAGVDEADLERLKDLASDAPVIRAVNALISRAAEARASDIHLEPTEDALKVRYRVDGVLKEQPSLSPQLRAPLVSRIKVMAGLNIAERRLPQDGRLRLAVRGHEIDLRVATSPTLHGEAVVLRLLDRSNLVLDFKALGFEDGVLHPLLRALNLPHGVLLVTGPTGSGKTTTLYAALTALNTPDRKILTIEDPIEYRLAGVNQTQVSPTIGLSFAAALRSFLRQDPDVMMVGEIRDLETAQVAVQAALTGHSILSTLHTNSAASAVTRLLDMGVEPFLITSTLNGVLAQRLVRRLCVHCREPYEVGPDALAELTDAPPAGLTTVFRAGGCLACNGSGYAGRIALVEFMPMSEALGRLVLARAEARDLQQAAAAKGMRSMAADGLAKILGGLTTLEEVLRVTRED